MGILDQFMSDRLQHQQQNPSMLAANPSSSSNIPDMNDLNAGLYATVGSLGLDPMNQPKMTNNLQAIMAAAEQRKLQEQQAQTQQLLQKQTSQKSTTKSPEPQKKKKDERTLAIEQLMDRDGKQLGEEYWANYYDNLSTMPSTGFGPGSAQEGTAPVQMWASGMSEADVRKTLADRFGDAVKLTSMIAGPDGKPIINVEVADGATFLNASQEKLDSGEYVLPKSNTLFKVKSEPGPFTDLKSAFSDYEFARGKTDEEHIVIMD